jgi:hypothetical protein
LKGDIELLAGGSRNPDSILLTLIHGPFATGATWTGENSELRRFFIGLRVRGLQLDGCELARRKNRRSCKCSGSYLSSASDPTKRSTFSGHSQPRRNGRTVRLSLRGGSERFQRDYNVGTPFIHVKKRDFRPAIRLVKLITVAARHRRGRVVQIVSWILLIAIALWLLVTSGSSRISIATLIEQITPDGNHIPVSYPASRITSVKPLVAARPMQSVPQSRASAVPRNMS